MIKPLFLSIPRKAFILSNLLAGTTYQQFKHPIDFIEDYAGVTNWVMRFPRTIYSLDLKLKHVFQQAFVQIHKVTNPSLEQKWKYFVITKADGKKYYCTAQTYYQKAPIKCLESGFFKNSKQVYRQFYVPRCLVLLSQMPYYKMHVNLMKIYRELKKPQPIISYSINEQLYKSYLYLLQNKREHEWNSMFLKSNGSDNMRTNNSNADSISSNTSISSINGSNNISSNNISSNNISSSNNIILKSENESLNSKDGSVSKSIISNNVMNNSWTVVNSSKSNEMDSNNSKSMRNMISCSIQTAFNYYLHSCNEHKAGQCMYLEKATNREVLHLYKLSSATLYQICYIYHLPLSPNTLRRIFSAIFQEKQILFVCNNQNLNALVIETIMQMILPLKWVYLYVPNLPSHMLQVAQQSFMPFIIGINKKHLHNLLHKEIVIVDIEENTCEYNNCEETYELDVFYEEYLQYQASDSHNYIEWEKQIRVKSLLMMSSLIAELSLLENYIMQYPPYNHFNNPYQNNHNNNYQNTNQYVQSHNNQYGQNHNNQYGQNHHNQNNIRQSQVHNNRSISMPYLSMISNGKRDGKHFYKEIINSSMMYKKYKEDHFEEMSKEMCKILSIINLHERKHYLKNMFNVVHSQLQYPLKLDNEMCWIRYYQQMTRYRRRYRFSRYSLNLMHQSKVSTSMLSSINSSTTIHHQSTTNIHHHNNFQSNLHQEHHPIKQSIVLYNQNSNNLVQQPNFLRNSVTQSTIGI